MTQRDNCQYDLFIAYAQDDGKWVEGRLCPALGLADDRVIREADFRPGAALIAEYERAVTTSRYTLLVVTPAYLADKWTALGENLASYLNVQEQQERLIPLLLRPCELPLRIGFRVRLDCTDEANWETAIARLRAVLNAPEPEAEDIPCPYPGMKPFEEGDARFFQGRETEIQWMLKHLRHQRFLLVVGPSGSGKSSLITAGLRPHLSQSGYFREAPWLIRQMRPGGDPWQTLTQIISGDPDQPAGAIADLLAANPPAKKLLLIIDQFEEVFSQVEPSEQKRFIGVLKKLREVEACALIVVLRADFYADLMKCDLWPVDQSQRLEVPPLKGEALRQAIEQPALAADGGVYLETRLVDALLADAANELGALPMLQETLVQLWESRQFRLLLYSTYAQLGDGKHSGLAVAMTTKADATLANLSQSQQDMARRIFLRLVQFGEGRADTRRRQPVSQLRSIGDDPTEFAQTLRRVTDNRLLTLDAGPDGSGEQIADISHEALFSGWSTLAKWVRERREAEQTRRQLEDKAAEWDHLGRARGGLLDTVELAEAKRWVARPDARDVGYSQTLVELIRASQAAQRRGALVRVGLLSVIAVLVIAVSLIYALDQKQLAKEKSRGQATAQALAESEAAARVVAETREAEAVSAKATAEANRIEALTNEARAWTELAQQQLGVDPVASLYWSSRALPSDAAPRPYVPKAEFVLREALQVSLERQYRHVSKSLEKKQIGLEGPGIATGGDGLHLVDNELTGDPIELASSDRKVNGVAWHDDGTLLSYGASDISIWRDEKQLTMHDFSNPIACAVWRPGQPEVAICSGSNLSLWSYPTQEPTQVYTFTARFKGGGSTPPASWSPDGRWLAAWDSKNRLLVWDAQSGKQAPTPDPAPGNSISQVAWSPDSGHLLTVSADGMTRVWMVGVEPTLVFSKTVTQTTPGPSEVVGARFVDDKRFLTWGFEGKAELWSIEGDSIRLFDPQAGRIHGIELNTEQGKLLTFMDDGRFYLWDLETGSKSKKEFDGHTKPVLTADWLDKRYLATGGADGTVRIWDVARRMELMTLRGHEEGGIQGRADVLAVRWQPGGRLLTAGEDGSLRVWQVLDANDEPICSGVGNDEYMRCHSDSYALEGHQAGMEQAHWLDNDTSVSADRDGVAQRWSLAAAKPQRLPNPMGARREAIWSPDGKQVLTYVGSSAENRDLQPAQIWNAETLTVTAKVPGTVAWATWIDTGLLVQDASGSLRLIDPATGAPQIQFRGTTMVINDAQANNDRLAAAGKDGVIYIWDLRTGDLLQTLRPDSGNFVSYVQWSPNGRHLVSAGWHVVLWDVEQEKKLWQSEQSDLSTTRPAFSPDGRYIAAGIGSNVSVWDSLAGTGEPLWSSPAYGQTVRGVQWVTGARWDGRDPRSLLLTWGGDGTVRLWDWESKAEIMRLAEAEPIAIAALSADGAKILAAGDNGLLRVWDAWLNAPQTLLSTATDPSRITREIKQ